MLSGDILCYDLQKKNDKTRQKLKIDAITSQFGLQQLNNEPIHVYTDSSFDLLFTSQPN